MKKRNLYIPKANHRDRDREEEEEEYI